MTLPELLLTGLATYRGTRLIIEDEITSELRDKIFEIADKHDKQKLAYLITCPWCVSIWVSGALITLDLVSPKSGSLLKKLLASSAIAGMVSTRF